MLTSCVCVYCFHVATGTLSAHDSAADNSAGNMMSINFASDRFVACNIAASARVARSIKVAYFTGAPISRSFRVSNIDCSFLI